MMFGTWKRGNYQYIGKGILEVSSNLEWNKWDDNKQQKYEEEEHLRRCPICRN